MTKLEELKAEAYDLLVSIQRLQAELQQVNQKIANYKEEKK